MFYAFTITGNGSYENPRVQRILTKEKNHTQMSFLKISNMSEERQEKIVAVYKTLNTAIKNAHKAFIDITKGETCLIFDSYNGIFYDINGNKIATGRWGTSNVEPDNPKEFWSYVDTQQKRNFEVAKKLGYI